MLAPANIRARPDLRAPNLTIENGAWGAYNTEFYPTYDFAPGWQSTMKARNK